MLAHRQARWAGRPAVVAVEAAAAAQVANWAEGLSVVLVAETVAGGTVARRVVVLWAAGATRVASSGATRVVAQLVAAGRAVQQVVLVAACWVVELPAAV